MSLSRPDRRGLARLAAIRARSRSGAAPWLVLAAAAALAGGVAYELWPVAIAGAAAIGWSFRPDLNATYLEGYTDGLAVEFPEDAGGDRALVRGLPASAGEDDRAPADGARGEAGSPARGRVAIDDLRAVVGLASPEPGPDRPFDEAGISGRIAEGARRSSFPRSVPPATPTASPVQASERRPAAGHAARAPRPRRQRATGES